MTDFDPELLELFKEESLELLGRVTSLIDAIRGGEPPEPAFEEIDRALHTIKGSVKMVGLGRLGTFVHDVEALSRKAARSANTETLDLLEESCDAISNGIDRILETGEDRCPDELLERVRRALEGSPFPREPSPATGPSSTSSPSSDEITWSGGRPKSLHLHQDSDLERPVEEVELTREHEAALKAARRLSGRRRDSSLRRDSGRTESGRRRESGRGSGSLEELVRVRSSKLAALDTLVSDLIDSRLRLDHHEQRLAHLAKDKVRGDSEPRGHFKELYQAFRDDRQHLDLIVKGLEQLAIDLRLRPLSKVFDHIARTGRDLARKQSKKVRIQIAGDNTELDRVILDGIKDPLAHIIRNVVDHGIETPDRRAAAGKDPKGTIDLSAFQDGVAVVIRVSDDGAGVNTEKLKARVIDKGLLTHEQIAELTHKELLDLVFIPGLSTRDQATETSGRGVGMDVVRRNVEALKGEARIDSQLGRGTSIELRVPLTLLVSRVLLVRSGGALFAIPTTALDSTYSISDPDANDEDEGQEPKVFDYAGQTVLRVRDRNIPVVSLARLLDLEAANPEEPWPLRIAVVRHKEDFLALDIDGFVGERSVVLKPLGWPLVNIPSLSGAILLGSGEIALSLHVPELLDRTYSELPRAQTKRLIGSTARRARRASRNPLTKRILVADDSPTYRGLARSTLEALGYQVALAEDGEQAWARLQHDSFDMLVTDYEMPRLDGLELIRRLRASESLRKLPVIMFSTHASDEDRRRGLEAGANVYIHKAEWNDRRLSDAIAGLLG